ISPLSLPDALPISREAPVGADARVAERPRLVGRREAEPQVALLLPEREAREERLAEEVAPPTEHRCDAYALPRAEGLVQALRGGGAAACEGAPALAPAAHPTEAAPGYGQTCV